MATKKRTDAHDAVKPHALRTFGFIDAPTRDAGYLKTLAEWGALPAIVPLPELAGLIARVTGQDLNALKDIIFVAAMANEIRRWGRPAKGPGHWELDMLTVLAPLVGKPHYSERSTGTRLDIKASPRGKVVTEAMGVSSVDVARLLRDRGVKVPPELMEYLLGPEVESIDDPEATAGQWWQVEHVISDMAQSIGERLRSQGQKTGQRAIAAEIASRIEAIERAKGTGRLCPSADTVRRHSMGGWQLKPE